MKITDWTPFQYNTEMYMTEALKTVPTLALQTLLPLQFITIYLPNQNTNNLKNNGKSWTFVPNSMK